MYVCTYIYIYIYTCSIIHQANIRGAGGEEEGGDRAGRVRQGDARD